MERKKRGPKAWNLGHITVSLTRQYAMQNWKHTQLLRFPTKDNSISQKRIKHFKELTDNMFFSFKIHKNSMISSGWLHRPRHPLLAPKKSFVTSSSNLAPNCTTSWFCSLYLQSWPVRKKKRKSAIQDHNFTNRGTLLKSPHFGSPKLLIKVWFNPNHYPHICRAFEILNPSIA